TPADWGYGGNNPYSDGSAWVYSNDTWWNEDIQDKCPNPIDFCFQTYGFSTTNPIAGFSYTPEEPSIGDEITFDASSSFDPNGNIVNYEWFFGDGDTSTGKITTYTYTQWEEYSVTLTVTDNDGKTDSVTKAITMIDNIKPIVNIVSPEINSLYILGFKIPFASTVIIGDLDIIIEATDNETGINNVELEIGTDSKTFWSEPYEYSWTETKFGKVRIKVTANDYAGNSNSDEIEVWKFF
ncbi:MAG: PKD domain-containing protein, partial [Candidatus Thermoplasmatota archaeon]|nr:PKD domain-containing protein [Candidatus Thermoplasmatota archaeon]